MISFSSSLLLLLLLLLALFLLSREKKITAAVAIHLTKEPVSISIFPKALLHSFSNLSFALIHFVSHFLSQKKLPTYHLTNLPF